MLSERRMMIPELEGEEGCVFALPGFNIIATANLRDRGVSEMSAALKRRLNFETVPPISDAKQEIELVRSRAHAVLSESGTDAQVDSRLLEILVTTFRDLREGRTEEGWNVERPAAVMSTAEAITVAAAITRQGAFFAAAEETRCHFCPATSWAWCSRTIRKIGIACWLTGTARSAAAVNGMRCGSGCTSCAMCSKNAPNDDVLERLADAALPS